jgi:hypothetical protein
MHGNHAALERARKKLPMKKLLVTATALAALLSSAYARPWTDQEREDGIQKVEMTRFLQSGTAKLLRSAYGVKPDCSVADDLETSITKQPEHGSVEFVPAQLVISLDKDDSRARCNGRTIPGKSLIYKSADKYEGTDEFETLIVWPTGTATIETWKLRIR